MKNVNGFKKRLVAVVLTGVLTSLVLSVPVFAAGSTDLRQASGLGDGNAAVAAEGGAHSEDEGNEKKEPVEIRTADDLRNIASDLSGDYVLMNDLDLENQEWTPIGTYEYPFTGTFCGNGHMIDGLKIDSSEDCQGLFGVSSGAVISRLGVFGSVTGKDHAAAVVGFAYNTEIKYCVNNASVNGVNQVGGVVGTADSCRICYCMNTGTISADGKACGGITGDICPCGSVCSCINYGTVRGGTDLTGGITGGSTNGDVSSCVNNGKVTCQGGRSGAIAGDNAEYAGSREDNHFLQTGAVNRGFKAIGSGSSIFSSGADKSAAGLKNAILEEVPCMTLETFFEHLETLNEFLQLIIYIFDL